MYLGHVKHTSKTAVDCNYHSHCGHANEETCASLQQRSEAELKKVLGPEDAPIALRLVINDAATYDVASGKGGVNGSIIQRHVLVQTQICTA